MATHLEWTLSHEVPKIDTRQRMKLDMASPKPKDPYRVLNEFILETFDLPISHVEVEAACLLES